MIDERISSGRRCRAASNTVARWCSASVPVVWSRLISLPRVRKISRILRTSVMSDTPSSCSDSSVSSVAHGMVARLFCWRKG